MIGLYGGLPIWCCFKRSVVTHTVPVEKKGGGAKEREKRMKQTPVVFTPDTERKANINFLSTFSF
jgi:hypothetical protein